MPVSWVLAVKYSAKFGNPETTIMSRIGKLPIPVLDKASVTIDGHTIRVEGPKGKLEKTFDRSTNIELSDGVIKVTPADSSRHAKAMLALSARSSITW